MTIGDILAVLAAVFLVGATWAATILLLALAFPARIERVQSALTQTPGRCVARGLGLLLIVGLAAIVLGQSHAGPIRILAGALWAALGVVAALGSGAAAKLLGARIESFGSTLTPFAALTRGTLLYVAAGFLPVIGWFLVTPVALLLTLGAGWTGLRSDRRAADRPSGVLPQALEPTL